MSTHQAVHKFHIPVMGIGFSVDTPIKVAHWGITSAMSMVDDILVEKLRKFYTEKFDLPFEAISSREEDSRAKRFTAYFNMVQEIVGKKFEDLKLRIAEKQDMAMRYMDMLPERSEIKAQIERFVKENTPANEIKEWLDVHLPVGDIEANIMTKLDKQAIRKGEALPDEYRDAHSALRGFANSNLTGSMIFSAGMNPRLYAYCEQFDDFYPNAEGQFKKRIVLKVSDYRSAIIQGKYFAKKGLWISEYRIESGLNCGGHAFATDGYLIGPILEDFKKNRQQLIDTTYEMFKAALEGKGKTVPQVAPKIKISAQGGVGTHAEQEFLYDQYDVDSVGWGTPFLLAPDVTNVDDDTLSKLARAKENDLYLSDMSPLGVKFNSLYNNSKDAEMASWREAGTPGSPCPKRFASLNTEFTEHVICTASRQYLKLKINEIEATQLSPIDKKKAIDKLHVKSCICVGLGTAALIVNNLDYKTEGPGVSVCPGPNMAYFSRKTSLFEMTQHIYGRTNIISRTDRPNMFLKELRQYVDHFRSETQDKLNLLTDKERKQLQKFRKNLNQGIAYYQELFGQVAEQLAEDKDELLQKLFALRNELNGIELQPSQSIVQHGQAV